jgi:hypothetical protein
VKPCSPPTFRKHTVSIFTVKKLYLCCLLLAVFCFIAPKRRWICGTSENIVYVQYCIYTCSRESASCYGHNHVDHMSKRCLTVSTKAFNWSDLYGEFLHTWRKATAHWSEQHSVTSRQQYHTKDCSPGCDLLNNVQWYKVLKLKICCYANLKLNIRPFISLTLNILYIVNSR